MKAEKINLLAAVDQQIGNFFVPYAVGDITESHIEVAKFDRGFDRHSHANGDMGFLVIERRIASDLSDGTVGFGEGECLRVPRNDRNSIAPGDFSASDNSVILKLHAAIESIKHFFALSLTLNFLRRKRAALLFGALLFSLSTANHANEVPIPTGKVILTISGNISNTNSENQLLLDQNMLNSLPVTEFTTATPWTEGTPTWAGVRLSDLLEYAGANSARFKAAALDEYSVNFEGVDIEKFPVILAYKKDDVKLTVRQLGPLWIMFPFDDYPELKRQTINTMAVWQLSSIEIL